MQNRTITITTTIGIPEIEVYLILEANNRSPAIFIASQASLT